MQDEDGWTALHFAATKGRVDLVHLLILSRADHAIKVKITSLCVCVCVCVCACVCVWLVHLLILQTKQQKLEEQHTNDEKWK